MYRHVRSALLCVSALSLATMGCQKHVVLEAPEADAPGPERVSSYQELQATSSHETHVTYLDGYGNVTGAARRVDYLQLANGERVYFPGDLLPVLPEGSAASLAAERSEVGFRRANTFAFVGLGMISIGLAIAGAGISSFLDSDNAALMFVGGGVALGGSVTSLIGLAFGRNAEDEKATAFELYNQGLAMRLNVCSNEKMLVPCEGLAPDEKLAAAPTAAGTAASAQPSVLVPSSKNPPGVAGFEFVMTEQAAQQACEGAGLTWSASPKVSTCSGPAKSVGVPGNIQLLPCGGQYCQILFLSDPEAEKIVSETVALKEALEKSYGPPQESQSVVPQDCREDIVACIDRRRAYLHFVWEFENGQRIKLQVGKKPEATGGDSETPDHRIRLLYTRPVPAELAPANERAL